MSRSVRALGFTALALGSVMMFTFNGSAAASASGVSAARSHVAVQPIGTPQPRKCIIVLGKIFCFPQ